jgi:hypothetical protein
MKVIKTIKHIDQELYDRCVIMSVTETAENRKKGLKLAEARVTTGDIINRAMALLLEGVHNA